MSRRVPGVSIRDCAGSPNNDLVLRITDLSAIDVTAKAICELVPGPRRFAPFVTMSCAPTPPLVTLQLFLDFPVFSPKLFLPVFCCSWWTLVGSGGVGAEDMMTNFAADHHPGINKKLTQIASAVASIALSLEPLGIPLLEVPDSLL